MKANLLVNKSFSSNKPCHCVVHAMLSHVLQETVLPIKVIKMTQTLL